MIDLMDYLPWTWPVEVVVFDIRNKGLKVKFDKGKAKYDKEFDIPEYRLKNHKIRDPIRPPSLRYINQTAKGKDVLFLLQTERNHFTPCLPPLDDDEEVKKIKAKSDEDVVVNMWNRTIRKKKAMIYKQKDWWDKYGALISVGIVGAIVLFSVIFMVNFMKKDLLKFEQGIQERHMQTLDKMSDVITVAVSGRPLPDDTSSAVPSEEPPPS